VVYQFGAFVLDTDGLELKRDGTPVEVEPQVFSVLTHLIENRHRVVTKDELIDAVWHGRAITDSALNTRINAVRRAVGDDGRAQAVIKTFHRRGFRFVADAETDSGDETETERQPVQAAPIYPSPSGKPAIAVLPFKNLSDDPGQEFFADGITEDLITGLSKLSGLLVINSNSSFFYKEKPADLDRIGRDLGVDFILQGSVRKAGDRVRITAQLTDLRSGHLVWAEHHDGAMDDIFALQDEITGRILAALPIQLAHGERQRLASQYTASTEAHEWFMRGRIRYREPGPQANADAQEKFNRALALDPGFAWALAIRAYVRFHAWFFKWNTAADALDAAIADAERAVAVDPALAAGHSYLGWIHMWRDGHDRALAEHETALTLNPNFAEGYGLYASTLIYAGHPERAMAPMDLAMQLDPHFLPHFRINFGHMYLQLGRYDEADRHLEIVRETAPDFPVVYIFQAAARAAAGNIDGARDSGAELLKRIPGATATGLGRQFPYARPDFEKRVVDGLRLAGLPD